jgi:hypothetical protein
MLPHFSHNCHSLIWQPFLTPETPPINPELLNFPKFSFKTSIAFYYNECEQVI